MTNVTCRGSYALGTACGKCSRCLQGVEKYKALKSVQDKLNTPSSALKTIREQADRIQALEAERDHYAALYSSAEDIYTEMHLRIEKAEDERDALRFDLDAMTVCYKLDMAAGDAHNNLLQAERDALRGALEQIKAQDRGNIGEKCQDIARAALEEKLDMDRALSSTEARVKHLTPQEKNDE